MENDLKGNGKNFELTGDDSSNPTMGRQLSPQ